jgi:cytidylate kinase
VKRRPPRTRRMRLRWEKPTYSGMVAAGAIHWSLADISTVNPNFMSKVVVVAIDGPAGAGKSTVARTVAGKLGYVYINSGAMYRAVALWAKQLSIDLKDHLRLERLAQQARIEFKPGSTRVMLNGDDVTDAIADHAISEAASIVSAVPGVRRALVAEQRRIAEGTSVVMEGRDIGTVVFPDAAVKIFLDADVQVRAERRIREMEARGVLTDPGEVASQIAERDMRDSTRAEAPMLQAPDAVYVDSTGLDAEGVSDAILRIVRSRISNGKDVGRH